MLDESFDTLSPPAQDVLRRALAAPASAERLLLPEPQQQQQQAQQKQSMARLLQRLAPDTLLSGPVVRAEEAACALAGLWLSLDELDRAHDIVQQIGSPGGSFWHAILHRREGDWSNSKYWYARSAAHPVLVPLGEAARRHLAECGAAPAVASDRRFAPIASASAWDGHAMVDLARALHDRPDDPHYPAAVELQRLEWAYLLDHCIRAAAGRA